MVPAYTLEDRLAGLGRATTMFAAAGLTSVCDASTGPEDIALFEAGQARGLLKLRVSMLVRHASYDAVRRDNRWLDGEFLRMTGVKAVLDGAIGGRTCLLEQPFEGTTDDHGIQAMSTRELREMMRTRHPDCTWAVEYRTQSGEASLLSPTQGAESVTISVHQAAELPWDAFFRDAEAIFLASGGRPHWGKLHFLDAAGIARRYPALDAFRVVRRALDPTGAFVNDHLAGLGFAE